MSGATPRHTPFPHTHPVTLQPHRAAAATKALPLDALEHALGGLNGRVNVGVRVAQRGEARLELGGREVDALLQHAAVEGRELGCVRLQRIVKVVHGALRGRTVN